MTGRIFALLLGSLVINGACGQMSSRTVQLGGTTYTIPADHIDAMNEPGEGRVYVRLAPPGSGLTLIFAESANISRNWLSEDAPLVTHINDTPADGLKAFDFPGGKTVCRSDVPLWSCGLRIGDVPTGWSVLFNRENLPKSEAMRAAASELLTSYRGNSHGDGG